MHGHPDLVRRVHESLEVNGGRVLNLENIARFYQNLEELCEEPNYERCQI